MEANILLYLRMSDSLLFKARHSCSIVLQWLHHRKIPPHLPTTKKGRKFIPLQSLKYPASKPNHTLGEGCLFILSAWYPFSTGDFQGDDNFLPAQFNHQRCITQHIQIHYKTVTVLNIVYKSWMCSYDLVSAERVELHNSYRH